MKEFMFWNSMKLFKLEGWIMLQNLCDLVFGEGVVEIGCMPDNALLMHLRFVDGMKAFQENFEAMLKRLYVRMKDHHLEMLVEQVKLLVDLDMWGVAYARLVAWDLLWDNYWTVGAVGLDSFVVELVEDMPNDDNPITMVRAHDDLLLNLFKAGYGEGGKDLMVLVRAPWNRCLFTDNAIKDYLYYRELAHETFVQVDDAADEIAGIIVIDQAHVDDETVCYSFRNPYYEGDNDDVVDLLMEIVKKGDGKGLYESFDEI